MFSLILRDAGNSRFMQLRAFNQSQTHQLTQKCHIICYGCGAINQNSRRAQAVYGHFLLSIPTFFPFFLFFTAAHLKALEPLRGDQQDGPQMLKNLIFGSLVNVNGDS